MSYVFDTDHTGRPSLTYVQDGTTRVFSINGLANDGAHRFNVDSYLPTGETEVTFYTNGRRLPENAHVLSKRDVLRGYAELLISELDRLTEKLAELRPDHARLAYYRRLVQEHKDAFEDDIAYDLGATVCAVASLAKVIRFQERLAKLEREDAEREERRQLQTESLEKNGFVYLPIGELPEIKGLNIWSGNATHNSWMRPETIAEREREAREIPGFQVFTFDEGDAEPRLVGDLDAVELGGFLGEVMGEPIAAPQDPVTMTFGEADLRIIDAALCLAAAMCADEAEKFERLIEIRALGSPSKLCDYQRIAKESRKTEREFRRLGDRIGKRHLRGGR